MFIILITFLILLHARDGFCAAYYSFPRAGL